MAHDFLRRATSSLGACVGRTLALHDAHTLVCDSNLVASGPQTAILNLDHNVRQVVRYVHGKNANVWSDAWGEQCNRPE